MKKETQKRSVADVVTNRILDIIEQTGELPWHRPWLSRKYEGAPRNLISGKPYQGVNAMLLAAVASAEGFTRSSALCVRFKLATMIRDTTEGRSEGGQVGAIVSSDNGTKTGKLFDLAMRYQPIHYDCGKLGCVCGYVT